jgi:LmbE family N-acetylglucosaminyl deacetylase
MRVREHVRVVLKGLRGHQSARDVAGDLVPGLRSWARRPRPATRFAADAPVLVLSPHLDDAVLGCWSLLSSRKQIVVANVFDGVPPPGLLTPWDRLTGATDSAARMHERLQEDREALALAGHRSIGLGFLEEQSRQRAPSIAAILSALGERVPFASRLVVPAGIGGRIDHVIVRNMAHELWRRGIPVQLYTELFYAAAYGWPAWVTGQTPNPHLVQSAYWEAFLASSPWGPHDTLSPRVSKLTDEQIAAKLEALRKYRTQYPALSGGDRDSLADPLVLGFEVFWTVPDTGEACR